MKILLATDGSEDARAASDFFERLPLAGDSEVTLLNVIDEDVFKSDSLEGLSAEQRAELQDTESAIRDEGEKLLKAETERLRQAGWTGSSEVRTGHPAEEIVCAAEDLGSDLIILGSHGLAGIKRYLMGSVSSTVLAHAPCSVLVVKGPEGPRDERMRFLIAYDGSESANKAVDFCAALPLDDKVDVTALTVLPLVTLYRQDIQQKLSWFWQEKKRAAREALDRITSDVHWGTPNVSVQLRESPDVSHEILDAATEMKSDLIVVGHKGKGAIEQFLLGSVTIKIAGHAHCSVLAVRT